MLMGKNYIFIVLIYFSISSAKAQLTVDTTLAPAQLVQNVLLGNGISASHISFLGARCGHGVCP